MAIEVLTDEASPQTSYYQFETPRDPLQGASPLSRWLTASFLFTDQTASVIVVHIPPMSFVTRVVLQISTAWTGTTVVSVGDGADVAGWIAGGQINPLVAGEMELDFNSAFAQTGKLYQAGDTLDITFTGVATAGTGKVFIEMISYNEALTDS